MKRFLRHVILIGLFLSLLTPLQVNAIHIELSPVYLETFAETFIYDHDGNLIDHQSKYGGGSGCSGQPNDSCALIELYTPEYPVGAFSEAWISSSVQNHTEGMESKSSAHIEWGSGGWGFSNSGYWSDNYQRAEGLYSLIIESDIGSVGQKEVIIKGSEFGHGPGQGIPSIVGPNSDPVDLVQIDGGSGGMDPPYSYVTYSANLTLGAEYFIGGSSQTQYMGGYAEWVTMDLEVTEPLHASVPEPSTLLLLGTAMLVFPGLRKKLG